MFKIFVITGILICSFSNVHAANISCNWQTLISSWQYNQGYSGFEWVFNSSLRGTRDKGVGIFGEETTSGGKSYSVVVIHLGSDQATLKTTIKEFVDQYGINPDCKDWQGKNLTTLIENHYTFKNDRELISYVKELSGDMRTNRLKRERAERDEENRLAKRRAQEIQDFRNSLREGVETSDGLIIAVRGDLVQIQTNASQCTQRDYKQSCLNWISTSEQKWVKRSLIYPVK